jgi:hypothetical protein
MVISRVDYCNAILNNADKSNIKKLQGIMNLAARLIKRIPRQEHITPLLKELGWLPVEYRIKRKVATLVFKAMTSNRPAYLCEHLVEYKPNRDLRSADSSSVRLVLGTAKGAYGKGAWSACAPRIWNELPGEVRRWERVSVSL